MLSSFRLFGIGFWGLGFSPFEISTCSQMAPSVPMQPAAYVLNMFGFLYRKRMAPLSGEDGVWLFRYFIERTLRHCSLLHVLRILRHENKLHG